MTPECDIEGRELPVGAADWALCQKHQEIADGPKLTTLGYAAIRERLQGARKCCRKHWSADTGLHAKTIGTALMNPIGMPFMVCKTCDNKRCPKATDCDLDCTNSNESGQTGSIYG